MTAVVDGDGVLFDYGVGGSCGRGPWLRATRNAIFGSRRVVAQKEAGLHPFLAQRGSSPYGMQVPEGG